MAPDQAGGQQGEAQPAADQYSLGVVLYELVCGRSPFQGPPAVVLYNAVHVKPPRPRELNPDLPRELERIILRTLAKDPTARYPSCQALADDLTRWLSDEPVKAKATRSVMARPAVLVAAGVAVLVLVGGTVAGFLALRPPAPITPSFAQGTPAPDLKPLGASRSVTRPKPALPPKAEVPQSVDKPAPPVADKPALPQPPPEPDAPSGTLLYTYRKHTEPVNALAPPVCGTWSR